MARKIVRYPKIRIRQVRSVIGSTERQRAVLKSLGLKKMNQSRCWIWVAVMVQRQYPKR